MFAPWTRYESSLAPKKEVWMLGWSESQNEWQAPTNPNQKKRVAEDSRSLNWVVVEDILLKNALWTRIRLIVEAVACAEGLQGRPFGSRTTFLRDQALTLYSFRRRRNMHPSVVEFLKTRGINSKISLISVQSDLHEAYLDCEICFQLVPT